MLEFVAMLAAVYAAAGAVLMATYPRRRRREQRRDERREEWAQLAKVERLEHDTLEWRYTDEWGHSVACDVCHAIKHSIACNGCLEMRRMQEETAPPSSALEDLAWLVIWAPALLLFPLGWWEGRRRERRLDHEDEKRSAVRRAEHAEHETLDERPRAAWDHSGNCRYCAEQPA